jgi:hypothetical protein
MSNKLTKELIETALSGKTSETYVMDMLRDVLAEVRGLECPDTTEGAGIVQEFEGQQSLPCRTCIVCVSKGLGVK